MKQENNSFDKKRRIVGAILGPLFAVVLWLMPIEGINEAAHHLLAIMALVAVWWITEPVSIAVSSLLGPTLCVLLGVAPMSDAFANFANPMIFLFMGGFLLAKAMMVNGLDKRIAYGIMSMKWVGDSPRRIFLAIGLVCIICSGWVSNTATCAMMFPISLGLLETIRDMMSQNGKTIELKNYKYATGLMLMTAYACSIGGVMTPIGTPPNLMMMGFLEQLAPDAPSISFFDWMVWGVVAMVVYFILAYVVLIWMFPADVSRIEGAQRMIRTRAQELGKWTRAQKNTVLAFSVAVVLWVLPSVLSLIYGPQSPVIKLYDSHVPEGLAAMVGALLLFFLPVDAKKGEVTMTWKDGLEGIDWSTLLLFGGGLALGSLIYSTGLSEWVGGGIKTLLGNAPSEWFFVALFCLVTLLLAEFTSHTAAINLMGSIAISTAVSMDFSPIPVAVGIALASSLGFMMPVSTPPNAIVYASGMVPITKMMKSGIIIDIIGVFAITVPIVMWLVKTVMGV
jgi:sodium-dependent dicarboxylate transporter 2/3/5